MQLSNAIGYYGNVFDYLLVVIMPLKFADLTSIGIHRIHLQTHLSRFLIHRNSII